MTPGSAGVDAAAYARIFEEEQTQLVAYARSLTGNPWLAEDVVAEAHFRVWRRLSSGHEIDNVAAYLMRTVRNLAATVGGNLARETPVEPSTADTGESEQVSVTFTPSAADPSTRVSQVDLLRRVLGQLPERWVKALWLAEAEDQSLDAIGRRIGVGSGATAVLLHRAREGMRQAFLRAHPGTPQDPACEIHWERIPALVREAAAPRHAKQLRAHMDGCEDCRARYLLLARANNHLGALVGPALLVLFLGGGAKFLAPLVTGAAAGAASSGAGTGATGSHLAAPRTARTPSGTDHAVQHLVTGGFKLPSAVLGAVGVGVTGAVVGVALLAGAGQQPLPAPRTATHQPAAVQTNPPAVPASPLTRTTEVGSVPLQAPAERHDAAPPQDAPSQAPQVPPAQAPQDPPAQAPQDPPAQAPQDPQAPAAEPGLPETPKDPVAEGTPPQAETATNPAPAAEPDQATPTDPAGAAPTEPAAPEPDPVQPSPEPVTPQPVNPVPTEPDPGTPAPSNPVQPPVDPAPSEPVEPAPVDPPPTEPVEPAPVDPPPTEPMEPAPVDPPPTTEPVDPGPVCHDILRGGITVTICYTAGG